MAQNNLYNSQGWWGKAIGAGIVAGLAMGMYEMIAMWAMGRGFFAPLNMMAATFSTFRPPAEGFQFGATLSGLLIHLATSALWALVLALAAGAFMKSLSGFGASTLTGLVLGITAWIITGLFIGPLVNPVISMAPAVHFFIGHMVFGLVTAWVLYAWAGGRHLAEYGAEGREGMRVRPA